MDKIKTMTMEWTGNSLIFIDQRFLPLEEIYVECKTYQDVAKSIKDMVVRGAPAIGASAAFGYVLGAKQNQHYNEKDRFFQEMQNVKKVLGGTRPTAVNLFWALNRMEKVMEDNLEEKKCKRDHRYSRKRSLKHCI